MGTVITLGLGNLEIDWGKNNSFNNHSSLFRKGDLKVWKCRDFDDDSNDEKAFIYRTRKALISKFVDVLPRLELLGYTNNTVEYLYYLPAKLGYLNKSNLIPYKTIKNALTKIDIKELPLSYKNRDYDFGEFARENIAEKLKIKKPKIGSKIYFEESFDNLNPYVVLRIMANNRNNLGIDLVWDFQELVENGWAKRKEMIAPLERDRKFIIITEGITDTNILKNAIKLLRPNIADFFIFIDMEKGYPFGGTGSLFNFCKGLVKIGVLNNTLVIYDNDSEGLSMYKETIKLDLPLNVRIMKLPVLEEFSKFKTIGPSGETEEDINNKAVSIECFLDLKWKNKNEPIIRWTSFHNKIKEYQGELINKNSYTENFLKQKKCNKRYNYKKLEKLLDSIISECVHISESKIID